MRPARWIVAALLVVLVIGLLAYRKTSTGTGPAVTRAPISSPTGSTPAPEISPKPLLPVVDRAIVSTEDAGSSCEIDDFFLKIGQEEARQWIPVYYEDVAGQLRLTPVENARLFELLSERYAELRAPLDRHCQDEIRARLRQRIEAFLGAERLPAFERYEESLDARYEVGYMAETLRLSFVPMSESQRRAALDSLLRPGTLLREREYAAGESAEALGQEIGAWMDQNDQLILATARRVLDARQLEEYTQFLEDRRDQLVRQEFRRAGVKPPAPSD